MIYFQIWQFIVVILLTIVLTAIITFFIVRKLFQKQLEKNPPMSEDTVRLMMAQMGRTPSEKQVRQVMQSINGGSTTKNTSNDKKADKKAKK